MSDGTIGLGAFALKSRPAPIMPRRGASRPSGGRAGVRPSPRFVISECPPPLTRETRKCGILFAMKFKIFISSVQSEFAKARLAIAEMVRKDRLLNCFFETFVFHNELLALAMSWTSYVEKSGSGTTDIVAKCKNDILNGECIQIVPSQKFTKESDADSVSLYRALRMVNPSPYNIYMKIGERTLIGSSPEELVKLEGRKCTTCPIAGTRPRGATAEEDAEPQ